MGRSAGGQGRTAERGDEPGRADRRIGRCCQPQTRCSSAINRSGVGSRSVSGSPCSSCRRASTAWWRYGPAARRPHERPVAAAGVGMVEQPGGAGADPCRHRVRAPLSAVLGYAATPPALATARQHRLLARACGRDGRAAAYRLCGAGQSLRLRRLAAAIGLRIPEGRAHLRAGAGGGARLPVPGAPGLPGTPATRAGAFRFTTTAAWPVRPPRMPSLAPSPIAHCRRSRT